MPDADNWQIRQEIEGAFDFLYAVYGLFGFQFKLKLSTRPEKFIGEISLWDLAEKKLEEALISFTERIGAKWELNPGDGAFYGPKIDITVYDALRRDHQCGTIQLDFMQPQRFKLRYVAAKDDSGAATNNDDPELPVGYARPVMIHRAVLGSFERMIGILTEHFAGKWPFWLSPRQVLVVPVMPAVNGYAQEVQKQFHDSGLFADVDLSSNTFQKKIRTGQLEQYNFIFGKHFPPALETPICQSVSFREGCVLTPPHSCRCPRGRVAHGQHPQPRRPEHAEQGRADPGAGGAGAPAQAQGGEETREQVLDARHPVSRPGWRMRDGDLSMAWGVAEPL